MDSLEYGWAFGLPENFGSGFSGFRNFGFPKMLPEIWLEKEEPENSGTRKFGFGFGFTRITRFEELADELIAGRRRTEAQPDGGGGRRCGTMLCVVEVLTLEEAGVAGALHGGERRRGEGTSPPRARGPARLLLHARSLGGGRRRSLDPAARVPEGRGPKSAPAGGGGRGLLLRAPPPPRVSRTRQPAAPAQPSRGRRPTPAAARASRRRRRSAHPGGEFGGSLPVAPGAGRWRGASWATRRGVGAAAGHWGRGASCCVRAVRGPGSWGWGARVSSLVGWCRGRGGLVACWAGLPAKMNKHI